MNEALKNGTMKIDKTVTDPYDVSFDDLGLYVKVEIVNWTENRIDTIEGVVTSVTEHGPHFPAEYEFDHKTTYTFEAKF